MKRFLTIILSVLVLFSVQSFAFAEDSVYEALQISEGSRIPKDITFSNVEGRSIEPEYTYNRGISTFAIGDVQVRKGSRPSDPELNAGAHYYAFSPLTTNYEEAYTRIQLPTMYNNALGTRNGYISLGIFGSAWWGVDLGLRNDGNGWHPYYYDVYYTKCHNDNGGFIAFDSFRAPATATSAVMVVRPISTTQVLLYIQYKKSNGTDTGEPFYQLINIEPGNFVMSNGYLACNYYRFASLVNLPGLADNQEDNSYMLGGNFNGLALYNRSTQSYDNWGVETNLIERAWEVSPERIYCNFVGDTDYFDIDHWASE